MTLSLIVMDHEEQFLKFLDPDLCTITETIESSGLRTLELVYQFQDFHDDKSLFKMGNKIWVSGHENLQDCLYVINTSVKEDVYSENTFTVEIEEVLVELNYAPPFSQTDLTTAKGFKLINTNGKVEVIVNWNALNILFGKYFNIGVVQECISEYASRITITGTVNLMSLLRQIEEETGNVFVTRYEKDIINNTIHRYLDFLNPINTNRDWIFNIEYDFLPAIASGVYDANDNLITDVYEDVFEEDDLVETPSSPTVTNLDPSNTVFRFLNKDLKVLNLEGIVFKDDGDTALSWSASSVDFENNNQSAVISICKSEDVLGLSVNNKSFAVTGANTVGATQSNGYLTCINDDTMTTTDKECVLPDDSYFEIYDTMSGKPVFRTMLNTMIGRVHNEVLDFGYNMENVVFNVDESETFMAVSPLIQLNDNTTTKNEYQRSDIDNIITSFKNLSIIKGSIIPMSVQKITVDADSLENAKRSLGGYVNNSGANISNDLINNYWKRPLRPNDNEGSSYEFLRAISYWKAPFTKNAGELYITTDKNNETEYTSILNRPDNRQDYNNAVTPKMGNVETNDEDIYNIYNAIALQLQESQTRTVNIEVDVANLKNGEFNNYDVHDKVYIKLPDSQELCTARVVKTVKYAHDMAKNTVELSNYTIGKSKTIENTTYINASNTSFTYPQSKTLTATLINADYDQNLKYSVETPANKLLNFTVYDSSNNVVAVYPKLTNANGQASISMKYKPDNYTVEISFMGDEEYFESNITIEVNVNGTIEENNTSTTSNTSSKTVKTTTNKKTINTYWSKCGVSPDKKRVIAVAKPSSSDANKYSYTLYKTEFKNKCPECGKTGTLRFDGGSKNKCITSAGARGRGYKINVPEHEITCIHCDSDFCGVSGLEKDSNHSTRLKVLKKHGKSNNSEFGKLVKGQLKYGTKTVTVKSKNNTSTKTRQTLASGIPSAIRNKALSIVKNSEGIAAAKKIAKWVGKNIKYEYNTGFYQSASQTLNRKLGNCCCQAELMLMMMDAVGCTEKLTLKYVHVCCNAQKGVGHIFTQIITKSTGNKRYVDPTVGDAAWGHHNTRWGSISSASYKNYPSKPF